MGIFDSIESSIESRVESEMGKKATGGASGYAAAAAQSNQQTLPVQAPTSTENAVKVTIEFRDRIVTVDLPTVTQTMKPDGTAVIGVVGKPVVANK